MNFLSKLLLPKVAGPIAGVLFLLIAGLGVTNYAQSQRIESLSTSLASVRSEMGLWKEASGSYKIAADLKDDVIRRQTVSIKALKEKSDVAAAAYQLRLQTAADKAVVLRKEASDILRLESNATDELGLCRAARDLLEKELTQ